MPLRQEALAKQLSMSRMPVRDALRLLESEGLVRSRPQHGFTVLSFGADEIMEAAHIRYKLEGLALEKSIPRFTEDDRLRSEAALQQLLDADDGDVEAHARFHLALYEPCQMPRLLESVTHNLKLINRFLKMEGFFVHGSHKANETEHAELLQACVKQNTRMADAILYTHIVVAAENLINQIRRA